MSNIHDIKRTINSIIELIESLDAYRAGRPIRKLSRLEHLYSSLNLKRAPYKWKILRKDIIEILDIPKTHRSYNRLVTIHKIANYLSYMSFAGLLLGFFFILSQNKTFFFLTFIAAMIFAHLSLFLRLYENSILGKIYEDKKEKILEKGEKIKETIDYLIVLLMRQLRKSREIREKVLKLNFIDYKSIIVVRKPSRFNSKYKVLVRV